MANHMETAGNSFAIFLLLKYRYKLIWEMINMKMISLTSRQQSAEAGKHREWMKHTKQKKKKRKENGRFLTSDLRRLIWVKCKETGLIRDRLWLQLLARPPARMMRWSGPSRTQEEKEKKNTHRQFTLIWITKSLHLHASTESWQRRLHTVHVSRQTGLILVLKENTGKWANQRP